ncbi:M1 family metallopeptidase [Gaetbulibacter sp. M235]|uniref:M1 family metallopeptidase n=1 Tax=Gaetbulibacter sp. M235 TaxID=3126510 RepID=UPI00374FAB43
MKFLQVIFFLSIVTFGFSQQTNYVDFKTAKANISFGDLDKKEVFGTISYGFEILKNTDSIFIDANGFQTIQYVLDGIYSDSLYNGKQLIIKHPFKANTSHSIDIEWKTIPKKTMYFIDWENDNKVTSSDSLQTNSIEKKQIWTQGQGKYTSNWLPCFDDMNEKVEFDLNISFDENYEVIANGKLANKQINDSITTWHYDMQEPMSSYLLALAIGKYNKITETSNSGIPLVMYYYTQDSNKVEPTYRFTKQIFDFLESEIGVPYPWQNYKQVPVKDFLYAGMENTSTTIFSDAFVVDSIGYNDKNYVNVNAHELAHQWFGDLVTETSGTHHWLQEGFATYYALLAEKNIFGEDYYYWRLYEYAQELLEQDKAEQSTSLLDSKASSTTFYKRGAWVLHALKEKVGDSVFKKAVINYLEKYQFKNVETNDFIAEVEKVSKLNLKPFVEKWLENKVFPFEDALNSLKKSNFIQEYVSVNCGDNSSKCEAYLTSGISDEAKIKIIEQNPSKVTVKVFNNSLKVRQAIAKFVVNIPLEIKELYESLLNDKSYITIEMALLNLWRNFPDSRFNYLDKTKGIIGFNDRNVRMIWLALALNTPEYEQENKLSYFEELRNYTSPKYDFETRQNAFQYLDLMKACDSVCKDNLTQATKHHNWRFSKFSKDMLKGLN